MYLFVKNIESTCPETTPTKKTSVETQNQALFDIQWWLLFMMWG